LNLMRGARQPIRRGIDRRALLKSGLATGLAAGTFGIIPARAQFKANPFSLGVASASRRVMVSSSGPESHPTRSRFAAA
jgi:hypothetical protein